MEELTRIPRHCARPGALKFDSRILRLQQEYETPTIERLFVASRTEQGHRVLDKRFAERVYGRIDSTDDDNKSRLRNLAVFRKAFVERIKVVSEVSRKPKLRSKRFEESVCFLPLRAIELGHDVSFPPKPIQIVCENGASVVERHT